MIGTSVVDKGIDNLVKSLNNITNNVMLIENMI